MLATQNPWNSKPESNVTIQAGGTDARIRNLKPNIWRRLMRPLMRLVKVWWRGVVQAEAALGCNEGERQLAGWCWGFGRKRNSLSRENINAGYKYRYSPVNDEKKTTWRMNFATVNQSLWKFGLGIFHPVEQNLDSSDMWFLFLGVENHPLIYKIKKYADRLNSSKLNCRNS